MSKICVIGTGYVGLVTGTCFADLGNEVICLDIDHERIASLKAGQMPIYEPGLEQLVKQNVAAERLFFTTDYAIALKDAEYAFIAVGTPSGNDGEADLRYVRSAAEAIADHVKNAILVINKSTVPVGTGDWVADVINRRRHGKALNFSVVSNPEFLREGSAINDFMNPDRVVLGSEDQSAADRVAQLYQPLRCTIMTTDLRTAEMIKYASNAFLATRISFINEIANICEELGADVREVARGMGLDKRIGPQFLDAGLGWGGSCFPKDVKALEHMAVLHGTQPQLLQAVMEINRNQRRRAVMKLRKSLKTLNEKTIGVLGIAFKPNTDDIRDAAAIELIHLLQNEGAQIKAYDPQAMENASHVLKNVVLCENPYQVAEGADALVLATEWNEFKQLDFKKLKSIMKQAVILDGRNLWDASALKDLGFTYMGIGRYHLPGK
ncbi:MAG TPA: UDP-glucose/GDP-mannose dehydrogenase family protein [Anaerolineaceae bacterium]|jgi:UDPglucose 6-dehydrogenase|nr:UDP-glucose/GDP-mannose dehydrogenase family protein [Anaerolineaceae bacterium]NMC17890.1 UDP-glucose/GDP-mannose dehydrogenase family protein [Chloroflexota bacterium]HNS07051.1 UDP-glucose/GDP-mannose dehydrogenase family protein [Anaerolineaceae bacterium]HNW14088.1 UDP-glucose/GDP-mannose dehydrogenase family protein [Anaerolineaceae bacterium]HOE01987.1 UDP-glucose/GDP-mannose dehydrogenase family protein [Anaerolineaceae bacterium]